MFNLERDDSNEMCLKREISFFLSSLVLSSAGCILQIQHLANLILFCRTSDYLSLINILKKIAISIQIKNNLLFQPMHSCRSQTEDSCHGVLNLIACTLVKNRRCTEGKETAAFKQMRGPLYSFFYVWFSVEGNMQLQLAYFFYKLNATIIIEQWNLYLGG